MPVSDLTKKETVADSEGLRCQVIYNKKQFDEAKTSEKKPLHHNSLSVNKPIPKEKYFFWCQSSIQKKNTSDNRYNYINSIKKFQKNNPEWNISLFVDNEQEMRTEISNRKNKIKSDKVSVFSVKEALEIVEGSVYHLDTFKITEFIDGIKDKIPALAKDLFLMACLIRGGIYSDISTSFEKIPDNLSISENISLPKDGYNEFVDEHNFNEECWNYENSVVCCPTQSKVAHLFAEKVIKYINDNFDREEKIDGQVFYSLKSKKNFSEEKNVVDDLYLLFCESAFNDGVKPLQKYISFKYPVSLSKWKEESEKVYGFYTQSRKENFEKILLEKAMYDFISSECYLRKEELK